MDGREAAHLLGKSGLKREQLSAVWTMADADEDGELDPSEWAVAIHLVRQGQRASSTYSHFTFLVVVSMESFRSRDMLLGGGRSICSISLPFRQGVEPKHMCET